MRVSSCQCHIAGIQWHTEHGRQSSEGGGPTFTRPSLLFFYDLFFRDKSAYEAFQDKAYSAFLFLTSVPLMHLSRRGK